MKIDIESNIRFDRIEDASHSFLGAEPFNNCVVDGFFSDKLAYELENEFPNLDDPLWREYNNPLEDKKACNDWEKFKPITYQVFQYLISSEFICRIEKYLRTPRLYPDYGLSGGGWHAHGRGGKSNVHLDYSIHPKLGLERRINLLVYLNSSWKAEWGGALSFWNQRHDQKKPGKPITTIVPEFNRAVFFDTSQDSWHGLPEPMLCPDGETRRSIAVYYLTDPSPDVEQRGKALFAPYGDQENDPKILELIKRRSNVNTASTT